MRRSNTGLLTNVIFGSIVGITSGKYIFEESIKNHWEEQQQQQNGQSQGQGQNQQKPQVN
jgi:hypothetical protein